MKNKDVVTVITPIFNQQNELKNYLKCLHRQSYGFKNLQVLLIDNGSYDSSAGICMQFSEKYRNVDFIKQEHRGVSAARNAGIKAARGKYIFFLDADDAFSPNTISDCVRAFDGIYEHVDLLTYPIETIYQGKALAPHFRYQYLVEDGIYDLKSNAFIGQTTMNIVVKNQFEENALFDEDMPFSEDQKYCCDVLGKKLMMGFCKSAKYIYNRTDESASGRLSGACYIFESSMSFFEELFSQYEQVPRAFQGLYVNDIYWKLCSNILLPYHYSSENYNIALARIRALLRRCDSDIILTHPNFDFFEKFYLTKLKGAENILARKKSGLVELLCDDKVYLASKDIEIVVTRLQVKGTTVRFLGFLKSAFFLFHKGALSLYAIEDGLRKSEIPFYPSTHNYYLSHEPTQRFWCFSYECDVSKIHRLSFELALDQAILKTSYYFMPHIPVNNKNNIYCRDFVELEFQDNEWHFQEISQEKTRADIWLYYDCTGVEIDNGLRQFLHDTQILDGVDRYYVLTDKRQMQHITKEMKTVAFGSSKHRALLEQASKVITAFIENNNIFPFSLEEYSCRLNHMKFEVIYLQHGVLHIDMPWKYSPEKIIADKIVVASNVDYKLFCQNGFRDEDLWKTGLPRFDDLKKTEKCETKKILYAPSWRSYLVGANVDGEWQAREKKLLASRYYNEMMIFLKSERLSQILEDQGYELHVKLHPIFLKYMHDFSFNSGQILLKDTVDEGGYDLFITDFSSYLFDFLYLNIPFLSFIPDYEEFKCGMNGYRNVDFMNQVDEELIAKSAEEIINRIQSFMETKTGLAYEVTFFNSKQHSTMDLIYEKCME